MLYRCASLSLRRLPYVSQFCQLVAICSVCLFGAMSHSLNMWQPFALLTPHVLQQFQHLVAVCVCVMPHMSWFQHLVATSVVCVVPNVSLFQHMVATSVVCVVPNVSLFQHMVAMCVVCIVPHVSRFQHLVAILRVYSLAPEHLTAGPADALPLLLSLVAQISTSGEEMDSPPAGTSIMLPALCLLHAVSECDVRKLTLFGKVGFCMGDRTNGLLTV